jgi:hypothetical protein
LLGVLKGAAIHGPDVDWYRKYLPAGFSCSAQFSQAMNILHSNTGNPLGGEVDFQLYKTHNITVTLTATQVTVSKDGVSKSTNY